MICRNCVMDTTDPRISFDENGMCDNCTNYQKNVMPFYLENIKNNTFGPIANKITEDGRGEEGQRKEGGGGVGEEIENSMGVERN